MSFSLKQFLLLILFACFALAALLNSERIFMIELVKIVTFGTIVIMAYGIWAETGERRAYCIGYVLWASFYYITFAVLQPRRIDIGTDTLVLWVGNHLATGKVIWAVYEKTGHLLLSILFGLIGSWVTVYFLSQETTKNRKDRIEIEDERDLPMQRARPLIALHAAT